MGEVVQLQQTGVPKKAHRFKKINPENLVTALPVAESIPEEIDQNKIAKKVFTIWSLARILTSAIVPKS